MVSAPQVSLDPFSEDFLQDPYLYHDELRDAGAAVFLEKYGIWGVARYADVRSALADHHNFCSGRGVGLADFEREKPWRPPSLLLETDPPLHDKTRGIVAAVLTIDAVRKLEVEWRDQGAVLVNRLVDRGEFDLITDLAEVFPLSVFPDAIGIAETGREHLLPYASLAFNAFGPNNQLTQNAIERAAGSIPWVSESCKRSNLRAHGLGRQIFEAVDRGEIEEADAERLVRSFLTAGLDTTVNGIGNLLVALAQHPNEYLKLRSERKLARHALEESLRWDSTVQIFFRTTTADCAVGDATIPAGEKVVLFLAAANRDPRHWERANEFDVTRRVIGHVGFGHGIHNCVGQMVARIEASIVLDALLDRVESIELTATPTRRLNNTLRSWESARVRVH